MASWCKVFDGYSPFFLHLLYHKRAELSRFSWLFSSRSRHYIIPNCWTSFSWTACFTSNCCAFTNRNHFLAKGVSKSENRYVCYISGQSLGFALPINTTEEPHYIDQSLRGGTLLQVFLRLLPFYDSYLVPLYPFLKDAHLLSRKVIV